MKNGHTTRQKTPAGRYALLDELRGLDLVSMMLYHACWDMMFLFGIWMDWYIGWPGRLWQQSICWVFILLSGFCVPLGHRTLKRGAQVFAAGALVTVVTLVFMPEDRVVFGVLTFLGSAMLLTGVLEPLLKKIPPAAGLAVSAGCALRCRMHGTRITLQRFSAFCPSIFIPPIILPCCRGCFLFWAGYFLHFCMGRQRMEPLRRSVCPALGWMGRHSLLLYLLHQPVIYGVLSAAAVLFA